MKNNNDRSLKKTLYTVATVFMIIATALEGLAIIPLAWCIPMLVATNKAAKEVDTVNERPHFALAICNILFTSIISGILMLVADLVYPVPESTFNPLENNKN